MPEFVRDQVRHAIKVRGSYVTLLELRPPWRPENGPEWTSCPRGQLRYEAATNLWTLYWPDRNGRWHRWPDAQPTRNLDELFEEIDSSGAFWG